MANALDPSSAEALRAEHEGLSRRLSVRASVDVARRGLLQLFLGLLSAGITVKLGWDRYGTPAPGVVRAPHTGPPLFLWIATVVTVVLLLLALRSALRTRRLAREEEALFERYRVVRAALGLDA